MMAGERRTENGERKDCTSSWLTALLFAVLFGLCVLFASGCRTYTVVAADREVVPVRQTVSEEGVAEKRTYVEAEDDATGWYVPDAVMLELLGAE